MAQLKGHVDEESNKIHDFFNLFTLPVICVQFAAHMITLSAMPPDHDRITWLSLPRESGSSGSAVWSYLYWSFLLYICVDTIWILLVPRCVASPKVIIAHHLVCIVGWLMVHVWAGWEFYASAGLCVEINTFFLIAKRRFPRYYHVLSSLDMATWVLTRLLMFPIVAYNSIAVWLYLSHLPSSSYGPEQRLEQGLEQGRGGGGSGHWNSGLFMALFASMLTGVWCVVCACAIAINSF